MGSHTDYNMGFVMTMTIDRDTWIAARPREDNQITIYSCNVPGGALFSLDDIQRDEAVPWTNYVRGVAAMMRASGQDLRGFDGLVHSTVPFGSGKWPRPFSLPHSATCRWDLLSWPCWVRKQKTNLWA
jgi:galactokinase